MVSGPSYLKKFMNHLKPMHGFMRLWGDKDIAKQNFPKTYDTIQKVKQYQGEKIKNIQIK